MKNRDILASAFVAGFAIACGGFVNLAVGGIAGAVIFAFGLLTVINYGLKLYTGYVGFMEIRTETLTSFLVLAGNVLGCLALAGIAKVSPLPVCAAAGKIVTARLATGIWQCGLLAIGCGFIMTAVVTFGRKGNWYPLFFGIPCFILCGFPHCIADAFYYLAAPWYRLNLTVLATWAACVAGNFVGCNLYRAVVRPQN